MVSYSELRNCFTGKRMKRLLPAPNGSMSLLVNVTSAMANLQRHEKIYKTKALAPSRKFFRAQILLLGKFLLLC